MPSIVCLALCSQNFGPAVCIRCVYLACTAVLWAQCGVPRDFWHVCLALYSEHVLGLCAPSVCLTLVSMFCVPDSSVFWRECLVCVISMCSGHVYLALRIRFGPWGVYRLLFLLWVPGMTLACVPACQAATAGLAVPHQLCAGAACLPVCSWHVCPCSRAWRVGL